MEYINLQTGEVILGKTWLHAYIYYKKDSRKYGYKIRMRDIISLDKYKSKATEN